VTGNLYSYPGAVWVALSPKVSFKLLVMQRGEMRQVTATPGVKLRSHMRLLWSAPYRWQYPREPAE
jgi:hypothetical protein